MSKMESLKKNRIQIRIDSRSKTILERAAAYSNRNISDFILSYALNAAEEVIEKYETIPLQKTDWTIFYEALLHPPKPNEKLKKAFQDYQKRTQHKNVKKS